MNPSQTSGIEMNGVYTGGSAVTALPNARAFGLAMVKFSESAEKDACEATNNADALSSGAHFTSHRLAGNLNMCSLYFTTGPKEEPINCCFY